MRIAAETDRGKLRELNEDYFEIIHADQQDAPIMFFIADGMGGHNSGELASKLAVQKAGELSRKHIQNTSLEKEAFPSHIRRIFEETNAYIFQKALENVEHRGMGTTLIMAVIYQGRLYIGHVGDSRVYIVREHLLTQVTEDHSLIEELVRNGTLSRAEAENHPKKNIITRAVGSSESIEVDTYEMEIAPGDVLLFCTDGLTNMVDESEILSILEKEKNAEEMCRELIAAANMRGGQDNITVVVVQDR